MILLKALRIKVDVAKYMAYLLILNGKAASSKLNYRFPG